MSAAKATVIPNFLTAGTPRALRRLMLLNNKRLGAWHNYQIQFVGGKWFAWYHEDISKTNLNELIDEPKSDEVKE